MNPDPSALWNSSDEACRDVNECDSSQVGASNNCSRTDTWYPSTHALLRFSFVPHVFGLSGSALRFHFVTLPRLT